MNRVCMISQSSYPDPRVQREAEALADIGNEIDIICYSENKTDPKVEKFGSIVVYKILFNHKSESIIRYFLKSLFFFLMAFLKLQKLAIVRKYDLIQIHNMPEYHVFTALFQKLSGIPVILDLHDLTPELFESKFGNKKSYLILPIAKFLERISCSFSDKLITVTDACKENLVNRGIPQEKITLILNTPDKKIFRFDKNREYKIIRNGAKLIYHGKVAERFGLHVAIKAMKYINNRIPGSVFTIYGDYDASYKLYLEDQIKELGLEDNVHLCGVHPIEEIFEYIKDSDFGIVPYLNNLYMNLALSTKMFEYNASLLPVVASKLKSFSLIFDNESMAFTEPENALDMADKIIKLCSNPDRRKMLAERAYSAIQSISWQVMSERYIELINRTINSSSHAHRKTLHQQNGIIGGKVL